jgi:hypothetical protein
VDLGRYSLNCSLDAFFVLFYLSARAELLGKLRNLSVFVSDFPLEGVNSLAELHSMLDRLLKCAFCLASPQFM